MKSGVEIGIDKIKEILPHRPPFLFVDRVIKLIPGELIITERELRADEPYFAGHFPAKPIMPGVLITDGLAQTSGLLWGLSKEAQSEDLAYTPEIFFLAAANMKYTHPAYPGDIMRMTASPQRSFGSLLTYTVEALAGRNLIAKGSLTLALKEGIF